MNCCKAKYLSDNKQQVFIGDISDDRFSVRSFTSP